MKTAPSIAVQRWFVATAALAFAGVLGAVALAGITSGTTQPVAPNPAKALLLNGRKLTPQGVQVALGNFPTGGAVTHDGRYLWTVSAGFGKNDIRIVDTARQRVIQTIPMAGASGGIVLDSRHRLAYISGVSASRWWPSQYGLPGVRGNCILVYGWSASTGKARFIRTISVPPQKGAPAVQAFAPTRSDEPTGTNGWPQKLAITPNGSRLLVPLNLADSAVIVDLWKHDKVRYVKMKSGSYPFAAAILPNGRIGLVGNEASGKISVIDLRKGTKVRDITVGPPLSHPQGIVVGTYGRYAYVAVSALDQVVVVDLRTWRVKRTISVGRSAGLGTMPVALGLSPNGERLFVAESGADAIGVIRLPSKYSKRSSDWTLVGHIPTSQDPQAVVTAAAHGKRPAQLLYVSARGVGVGPNSTGPDPTLPTDPIFWAFNRSTPTTDVFSPSADGGVTYLAAMVTGRAGLMTLPSDDTVRRVTPIALRQLTPTNAQQPPAGTPLRANGPIKHVFFIVRENRSYDQLLGDIGRGNSEPSLAVFGKDVTPNLHALVTRFPLLDAVFANSEASIQGHFWTSAGIVPDYVDRNWVQQYGGRNRPNDFGPFAVSWPGNGFLFDQAERQHISYFNYGEGMANNQPNTDDRARPASALKEANAVAKNSDLGPLLTPGGKYPSDMTIGTALDGGQTFDSSLPATAPAGSWSHVDAFRERFASQLATGTVPTFNYLCLTSDHTRGTQPGFPVPSAMVADSDLAIGQIVETISHSPIWSSSAIFIVEDDCQDGADHMDAHRIPVAVISPYARQGAVINTRYDLPSVLRSMELIMGMRPLSLNDALATPMYDAFESQAMNAAPFDAIVPNIDLQSMNTTASPWAAQSSALPLDRIDAVPQWMLDEILWKSVYGANSSPPPPGPNAEYQQLGEVDDD
jgi:DNA-binding beta-propeller fold protein YncE